MSNKGSPGMVRQHLYRQLAVLFLYLWGVSALAKSPPHINWVSPPNARAGETIRAFEIGGKKLKGVESIEFSPTHGVTIRNVRAKRDSVTAELVLAADAFGEYKLAVVSKYGRSNELSLMVRGVDPSFVISNLRVGSIDTSRLAMESNSREPAGIIVPLTLDFQDPTGAVSEGWLRLRWTVGGLALAGEIRSASGERNMVTIQADSPSQTSGTLIINLETGVGVQGFPKPEPAPLLWLELPRKVEMELKIALEAPQGRTSNEVAGVLVTP